MRLNYHAKSAVALPTERVANPPSEAHNQRMASTAPSPTGKNSGDIPKRIGRSSVTGQFILVPATKGGTITIAKARIAANTVHSAKK